MTIARTLGVVAVLAVLTGCSASDAPTPQASSTPIVEATQARETGLTAPARPFGGDCGALMTEAEASTLMGLPVVLAGPFENFVPDVTIELHGGLTCRWVPVDPLGSTRMTIALIAEGAATYSQNGSTNVNIFDGPNWLHFQVRHLVNAKPLADALFAALDMTALP